MNTEFDYFSKQLAPFQKEERVIPAVAEQRLHELNAIAGEALKTLEDVEKMDDEEMKATQALMEQLDILTDKYSAQTDIGLLHARIEKMLKGV